MIRDSARRSGLIRNRLTIGMIAVAVISVGIGVAINTIGVTEQPAFRNGPAAALEDVQAASIANGRFALNLYQQLAEAQSGQNLFFSPFSISTVLSMAAEGAVDETRDQMLKGLQIPHDGLEQIHRGQRGLQNTVIPAASAHVTRKLATLRARLKETNKRTEELTQANRRDEAVASRRAGYDLARKISELLDYNLQIANAIWLEQTYPLEPSFIAAVKPNYGMVVFPVDFKVHPEPARLQINRWISQQTNNQIPDFLPPGTIKNTHRMLVANTVYFNAQWARWFDPAETYSASFQESAGRLSQVQMMRQENAESASYGAFTASGDFFSTPHEVRVDTKDNDPSLYPDADGHTMVSLDYQGGKIQMILLVPQSATGIQQLEKSVTYDKLQQSIAHLERRTVRVFIPKFKLESRYDLKDALSSLGITRCFANPAETRQGAQFDKLTSLQRPEDRLFISNVIHQTTLDVSELGTEAAAVTSFGGSVSEGDFGLDDRVKMRPFIPIFIANKPFIFLIRERETGTILFLGRYVSPNPIPIENPLTNSRDGE